MLWEKKISNNEQRGYLYIRETIYLRDKRTLKRKPPVKGDGSAYKQRGKYSKKKDIYCGKIIEDIQLQDTIQFKDYIEKKKQEKYLEYKTTSTFDQVLDDFIEYLLTIHNLDSKEFYEGKKKAYAIASGYLSKETINKIREFTPKYTTINYKELERFANKCLDAAIFDEEIIMLLYSKLLPQQKISEEFEEEIKTTTQSHKGLRGFIEKQHK